MADRVQGVSGWAGQRSPRTKGSTRKRTTQHAQNSSRRGTQSEERRGAMVRRRRAIALQALRGAGDIRWERKS